MTAHLISGYNGYVNFFSIWKGIKILCVCVFVCVCVCVFVCGVGVCVLASPATCNHLLNG